MNRFLEQAGGLDPYSLQRFVLQRLQTEGGFSATPMLPHTIQDTFCGIEILFFLLELIPNNQYRNIIAHEQTREYLADFAGHQDTIPARIKYQLVVLLNLFSISVNRLPPVGGGESTSRNYEELYYLSVLKEPTAISPSSRSEKKDFFSQQEPTVKECFFYIQWCSLHSPQDLEVLVDDRDALTKWLVRSQGYDGGFGFFPGTTSFIENCAYALAALLMTGGKPAAPDKAVQFILSCQTGSGGFSRNPKAAPFLESSFFALHAIISLRDLIDT